MSVLDQNEHPELVTTVTVKIQYLYETVDYIHERKKKKDSRNSDSKYFTKI